MYHNYSQEELRAYCRNCIESFEIWARRIIHERMVEKYGENYVDATSDSGEWIIKKEIRDHIHRLLDRDSTRSSRAVDALFVDNIIYFLCNPKWYKDLFKPALDYVFPQGCEEAREYLTRLIPVRNALSHANPISIRQAEQAVCYSHDFVEGIKKYYKEKGKERMWNIPRIIHVTDSRGNEMIPKDNPVLYNSFNIQPEFYVGDEYSVQIQIDPSFNSTEYTIHWLLRGIERKDLLNMTKITIIFTTKEVAQTCSLECQVISNKDWHRFYDSDDEIYFFFTVLPEQ